MNGFETPQKTADYFGVTLQVLRRWDKEGRIQCIRTGSGPAARRRYDIKSFKGGNDTVLPLQRQEEPTTVLSGKERYCYCRVSSRKQEDDLKRQITYLQSLYPTHTIVKEIASGLNFKRKGLLSILENASRDRVEEVIVAHKDRLCRFGFELIEWFFKLYGVKLIILKEDNLSPDQELSRDILNIIQVFACRANGKRKYTRKQEENSSKEEDQESSEGE